MNRQIISRLTEEEVNFIVTLLKKFLPEDRITVSNHIENQRFYYVFFDFQNSIFTQNELVHYCKGAIDAFSTLNP